MAESLRIDKWIWAVRMVKTRSLAQDLCKAGHVKINDLQVKPSSSVRAGDQVEVRNGQIIKKYKVISLIEKRVGAKEAALCFEDHSPPQLKQPYRNPPAAKREKGSGRPTKKERRQIERWSSD